jgi:hypothetical protein
LSGYLYFEDCLEIQTYENKQEGYLLIKPNGKTINRKHIGKRYVLNKTAIEIILLIDGTRTY